MSGFIPKEDKKKVVSIRVDINMLDEIDKLADQSNLSRNNFIIQCIDYAIKHIEKKNK